MRLFGRVFSVLFGAPLLSLAGMIRRPEPCVCLFPVGCSPPVTVCGFQLVFLMGALAGTLVRRRLWLRYFRGLWRAAAGAAAGAAAAGAGPTVPSLRALRPALPSLSSSVLFLRPMRGVFRAGRRTA